MKKRTLALLLALVFSLSLLPVGVLAEETTDYTANCTLTCDGETVTETTTANYFDEDVQHTIFYMEMEVSESCTLGLSGIDDVSLSIYSGDGAVSISDNTVTAESAGYAIISLSVDETADTYIYINVTDPSAYPTSGACGDSLSWTLEEGVLTISGTGAMDDYLTYYSGFDESNVVYTPWWDSRDNITAVVIEDGVTSIGAGAFFYCTNLTRVTIPSSVTSIGNDAFADCQGLPSISIPANVTSIGSYAFAWCTSLTNITVPAGITSIENGTFFYCSSLTRVTFSGNAPSFGEYDVFLDVAATAYYPANNDTWTEDMMLDYGGDITWTVAAEPVIGPVTGELEDILLNVGWYTFSNYFDLGEGAWERLVYRTLVIGESGVHSGFYTVFRGADVYGNRVIYVSRCCAVLQLDPIIQHIVDDVEGDLPERGDFVPIAGAHQHQLDGGSEFPVRAVAADIIVDVFHHVVGQGKIAGF